MGISWKNFILVIILFFTGCAQKYSHGEIVELMDGRLAKINYTLDAPNDDNINVLIFTKDGKPLSDVIKDLQIKRKLPFWPEPEKFCKCQCCIQKVEKE